MTIGEAIKSKRVILKMTQEDLAIASEYIGGRSTISRIESGNKNPSFDSLLKIADALKMKPSELLKRAGL